jgi:hypothetical protein
MHLWGSNHDCPVRRCVDLYRRLVACAARATIPLYGSPSRVIVHSSTRSPRQNCVLRGCKSSAVATSTGAWRMRCGGDDTIAAARQRDVEPPTSLLLAAVAGLTLCLPAQRAGRVDPAMMLRAE